VRPAAKAAGVEELFPPCLSPATARRDKGKTVLTMGDSLPSTLPIPLMNKRRYLLERAELSEQIWQIPAGNIEARGVQMARDENGKSVRDMGRIAKMHGPG